MDHSATTPVDPGVAQVMFEALTRWWGNPSSAHSSGNEARKAMDRARQQVGALIGASAQEITFTSGGTEADNLAVAGAARAYCERGRHLITSQIEHHAVLNTFQFLARNDFEVTYLPVDAFGQVSVAQLEKAIRPDTVLVSIMHANNEVGSLQPIADIAGITRERGIILHCDAVQTVGRVPMDVRQLGVDLLSLSGHKFYGPKGIGALYVRSGLKLNPLVYGGGQERNLRSGTENIPGIVGIGEAARIALEQLSTDQTRLQQMGITMIRRILSEIPASYLTGHSQERLPGHASFVFPGIEGASLVNFLDQEGIEASSVAACSTSSYQASHVLKAMGMDEGLARSSLRLSLGRDNRLEDIDRLMEVLPGLVERMGLLWSLQ